MPSTRSTTPSAKVLAGKFRTWLGIKAQVTSLTKDQNKLRDELKAEVETSGYEDDKGHIWLEFPAPIDGYASLKSEKRVTELLNEEVAETILKKKGILEECLYQPPPQLDPDEIRKQFYAGNITKRELDRIFTQQVTYAFVPQKAK